MKWIYRFLTIASLVAALAIPFFINNKDNKPMLELPTAGDLMPGKTEAMLPGNNRTVYKWKDANGVWHYGDQPPAGNTANVEKMTIVTDANIIQSIKPPAPETPAETEPTKAQAPSMTDANEDVLSFERFKNVMNDAKGAAQLMEQRNAHLKEITGDK
jgi:hypothetical protein